MILGEKRELSESETCSLLLVLLLWLFVSQCQSCHIYHGRVPWGQPVAHTHLSLSGPFEWQCIGTCKPRPARLPLMLLLLLLLACKVIATLSPGAIMPHLSTESYDLSTQKLLQSWLQLAARWGWGGQREIRNEFQTYVSLIIYVLARCNFNFSLLIAATNVCPRHLLNSICLRFVRALVIHLIA